MTQKKTSTYLSHLQDPLHPRLSSLLLVIGQKPFQIEDILIDTGFDGDIALPVEIAIEADIVDFEVVEVEFANGYGYIKTSLGNIKIDGHLFEVKIHWLNESDEALLGSGFLAKFSNYLNINYREGKIEIEIA